MSVYRGEFMEYSRYGLAVEMIREAAKIIPPHNASQIEFEEKNGHSDIVSQYDKRIEAYLSGEILAAFPSDGIIGEEMGHPERGDWIWYMDPIDGTTNFVNQQKNYAISLGCYHNGRPAFGVVYDVAENRMYHARTGRGAFCNGIRLECGKRTALEEMLLYTPIIQATLIDAHPLRSSMRRLARDVRAVRSLGSVALELCALAAGEADLFIAGCSYPWDHNAARIILEESGGEIRTWKNGILPLDVKSSVIAAGQKGVLDKVITEYWTD